MERKMWVRENPRRGRCLRQEGKEKGKGKEKERNGETV
jgi:hypothetical protein